MNKLLKIQVANKWGTFRDNYFILGMFAIASNMVAIDIFIAVHTLLIIFFLLFAIYC